MDAIWPLEGQVLISSDEEGVWKGSEEEEEEDGTRREARDKLNERNVRLWKPFFSFKCLFASVNLNTSFCKETILDS